MGAAMKTVQEKILMADNIFYSVVVPAFNEQETVGLFYERARLTMDSMGQSWELIFVNDGSTDGTMDILRVLAKKDAHVKYISLSRNFGHQAALTAGLDHASGKAIISIDCDLQDPPELIPKLCRKWEEGYEIVYARRSNYRKDNLIKRYASMAYYFMLEKTSDINMPENVGDFRLIDQKVLSILKAMPERARYLRGMVVWAGFSHAFVDYDRPDRQTGDTGYTFKKLISLGMDGMLNFSLLPLRVGFIIGIVNIVLGSLFLAYMILDTLLFDKYYHLYKFLVVLLFIMMGGLFMFIWILGEYIGRIYNEVKGRPIYIENGKGNFSS
jgi:glycosyltransferase involved in cell wall biosynthesis